MTPNEVVHTADVIRALAHSQGEDAARRAAHRFMWQLMSAIIERSCENTRLCVKLSCELLEDFLWEKE